MIRHDLDVQEFLHAGGVVDVVILDGFTADGYDPQLGLVLDLGSRGRLCSALPRSLAREIAAKLLDGAERAEAMLDGVSPDDERWES